jgi:hypothetical protein
MFKASTRPWRDKPGSLEGLSSTGCQQMLRFDKPARWAGPSGVAQRVGNNPYRIGFH